MVNDAKVIENFYSVVGSEKRRTITMKILQNNKMDMAGIGVWNCI